MGQVREPIKTASIEKKNNIISAGLSLFCEKGYYNTTTPEIAKKANVSTGIVYSYFKDKKDIFLQSLPLYFDKLYSKLLSHIKEEKFDNLKNTISSVIDLTTASHTANANAHEEMIAMSHLDEDVHQQFMLAEQKLTFTINDALTANNVHINNAIEKIHIAYNLVENYCHEYVFHRHDFIDYKKMKEVVVDEILHLLETK